MRLRNFRSFHGDSHRFDFRDRRLIGVVGPIGSGKSTILDAIAFALYGRTPRIGRGTRSLIHQRAEHAAVYLRFEAKNQVWEAVRQLRASGASQHALYRLFDDSEDAEQVEKVLLERDVKTRIEELLGLDFAAFGRSVLLAQGEFARFLTARPAERDKVLKGVFGYDRITTMRELAKEAVRTSTAEVDKLAIRIDHALGAKKKLQERREELALTELRIDRLRVARPLFEDLTDRIDESNRRRTAAEARLDELSTRARDLPDRRLSEGIADEVVRAEDRLAGAEHDLARFESRLGEAEAALRSDDFAQAAEELQDASRQSAEIEKAIAATGKRLGEVQALAPDLPDRAAGIATVEQAGAARTASQIAADDWEAATKSFRDAEAILAAPEFAERERRLTEAGELLVRREAVGESAQRAEAETTRAAAALRETETAEAAARSSLDTGDRGQQMAEALAGDTKSRLADAEAGLLDARHADMAGSLRSALAPGDRCPVCDQPVCQVPTIARDTSTYEAERAVERARGENDTAQQRLRAAVGVVEAARAELTAARSRVEEAGQRLAKARTEEEGYVSAHDKIDADLVRLLGEGDPRARRIEERAALDRLRASYQEARDRADGKRAALDLAIREESRAQDAVSDLRTRIGSLARMLDASDDLLPGPDPAAVGTGLDSLHARWRDTVARLEEDLAADHEALDVALSRRTETQAAVDGFHAAVEEARLARDRARAVHDDAVAAAHAVRRDLSDLRARIGSLGTLLVTDFEVPAEEPEALLSALASLRARWSETTAELARVMQEERSKASEDTDHLGRLRTEHGVDSTIEAALAETHAVRDRITYDIKELEVPVDGLPDLVAADQRHRDAVNLNQILVRDLTDSRFIRFLLDEERSALADLGSEHFERLSSGRYRFTEGGDFHIVDLNAAEAVRRADSLSGGETFLASLALALALADLVGRQGGRLDAFFLDEGFGTLDPQHLDLAMAGIESLVAGREARLVVVVSHVPELRERIEDLIELAKDPVTGNSIVAAGGTL